MTQTVDKIDQTMNWQTLPSLAEWTVNTAIAIQQIPAPTFAERQRASHVASQFTELGLEQVTIDDFDNVYGLLAGENSASAIMVSAHTDTVFDEATNLEIKKVKKVIYGPGIGDNSMGVAGMLGAIRWFKTQNIRPPTDIWFVATSREEGLGDLGGMRKAYERLKENIKSVVNIEGLAYGHIYSAGIAVRRLHIVATAEGGHSWFYFGRASAIHAIVELGSRIASINPPKSPRTTYNIGLIDGGHSINSIATQASLWLDMRSEERSALENLERKIREQVSKLAKNDISFDIKIVGDRPSGHVPTQHIIVQNALAILKRQGVQGVLEIGSTDGNIPLSDGCPTVTIGMTRGGNAHRLDEYIEVEPVSKGLRQLIVLVLATSQDSIEI